MNCILGLLRYDSSTLEVMGEKMAADRGVGSFAADDSSATDRSSMADDFSHSYTHMVTLGGHSMDGNMQYFFALIPMSMLSAVCPLSRCLPVYWFITAVDLLGDYRMLECVRNFIRLNKQGRYRCFSDISPAFCYNRYISLAFFSVCSITSSYVMPFNSAIFSAT